MAKISPLWQNLTSLSQISIALFSIWQNFKPLLEKYKRLIGQIFIVVNGQILNKLSSHLVTLTSSCTFKT